MPKDEIDPEDPHELVGVGVPVDDLAAAREALARGLVEEFVRFGYDADGVAALFATPAYAGAHQVWLARGEGYIRELADDAMRRLRPAAWAQSQLSSHGGPNQP